MRQSMRLLYWLWKVLPIPSWGRSALVWLGNTKFLVGVQGVVFNDADQVLLLRHTYREAPWGLPGGFARHEQLGTAMAREIEEETGLAITVGNVFHISTEHPRAQLTVYLLCHFRGGTFQLDAEIAGMRFFPLDMLPPEMLGQRSILEHGLTLWRTHKVEGRVPEHLSNPA